MKQQNRLLTLDSNVFIAALKPSEPLSERCAQILTQVTDQFRLAEPSIVYQEVCGTLARKVSLAVANKAKKQMDILINQRLLTTCDKNFCTESFSLCSEYNIYTIDALYLATALKENSILVSLDKEDFVAKLKMKKIPIEVYHVSEFPY